MENMSNANHSKAGGLLVISIGFAFLILSIGLYLYPANTQYKFLIVGMRIMVSLITIGIGGYLLWKKPRIHLPSILNLAIFSSILLPGLASLETGARIWLRYFATSLQKAQYQAYTEIEPHEFRWTRHPYLNYYPAPNFRQGKTFHNSLGYRNKEFSPKKPPGLFRIVALGGSTTYTIRVDDNEKTYPSQLEVILQQQYGYHHVEVINAGIGGHNSWETLINLEFRVLDLEPDLIIIYHGTNDVHCRLVEPDAYRGDNTGRRKQWEIPYQSFWEQSLLVRILTRSIGEHPPLSVDYMANAPTYLGLNSPYYWVMPVESQAALLQQNPPIYFKRNLQNMIAIANAHRIRVLLSTWAYSPSFDDYAANPAYQYGFNENNSVVKAVATETHTPIFDFAAAMPQDTRYWHDGRHVNVQGAALKAELFAEYLHNNGLIN